MLLPKKPDSLLHQFYPPTGFQFLVRFVGIGKLAVVDSFFQEVSGLNVSIETESYRQADRKYVQHLPVQVSYESLKLKRGYARVSWLRKWVRNAVENFDFLPATIHIQLMNEKMGPIASWTVSEAIPVNWSISTFDAESSNLVIESLELKYEYFRHHF